MKLLICTDGSSASIQTADLILKMKFLPDTRITILGVTESKNELDSIASSMDQIEKLLNLKYIIDRKIRNGDPIEGIMSEALEAKYDLVAVGGGGKHVGLLDPQLGSTTSNLARKLHTHFLVARNVPTVIKKVLFCTGAEAPARKTMTIGGEWISNAEVQIGLLHVLSQVSGDKQKGETKPENTVDSGKEIQDFILLQASQQLRNAGVKSEIIPRIRQGLVVEEILSELTEGRYELLVIGAHYQPGQDRWQGTLLDDVTDQLLNRCNCSVLIV